MEKDLIFFGEKGLTSTSANFVANLCKEGYKSLEQDINSVTFYTTTVKLLGSSDESVISEGKSSVAYVEPYLGNIAKYKALIAWLREAISAKERLIKEAQSGDYEYYGISVPDRPEKDEYITSDDVIASFSIKRRNRYYELEAYCATVGQYIHPDGIFARERTAFQEIIHKPNKVVGSGRDTLIYSMKASIPSSMVEDTFMALQQSYREAQAELNSIKHEIETIVNQDIATKNIAYENSAFAYKVAMQACDAELSRKRKEAVTAASNLKIIIPDSLKDVYDEVKELGKD